MKTLLSILTVIIIVIALFALVAALQSGGLFELTQQGYQTASQFVK